MRFSSARRQIVMHPSKSPSRSAARASRRRLVACVMEGPFGVAVVPSSAAALLIGVGTRTVIARAEPTWSSNSNYREPDTRCVLWA